MEMKENSSPLPEFFRSSFESLLAALWLIAGDNFPQALSMLHNSIELALKAELERIHPLLIVDSKKLDYGTLKMYLRKEFLKHPYGEQIHIKEPGLEKTIIFLEAVSRNKEIYPELITKWEEKLKELHKYRNQIIHAGANSQDDGKYVFLITSIAIPFLDDFFWISNQVSFEKELGSETYRELMVAKRVSDKLKSENLPSQSYILRTLKWKVLQENRYLPEPDGEDGYKASFEKEFVLGQQVEKEWQYEYSIEVICKICDSVRTFVKVDIVQKPKLGLKPNALYCPVCGLQITEKEKYLAEYHVGEIEQDIVDRFFDENRDALQFDGIL